MRVEREARWGRREGALDWIGLLREKRKIPWLEMDARLEEERVGHSLGNVMWGNGVEKADRPRLDLDELMGLPSEKRGGGRKD